MNKIETPKNLKEINELIREIGWLKRQIIELGKQKNEEIERIKKEMSEEIQPLQQKLDIASKKVYQYGTRHRKELTKNGKKTIALSSGWFGWRQTPPKVNISNTQKALLALKKLGLDRFIRTETVDEIDKEILLKEAEIAESIEGISITSAEDFVIAPSEIEIEIRAHHKSIKVR
jgi:phage host-nuclease inhibitor protein Gam